MDQYRRLAPLLIQVKMLHPVLRYQIDIGTARTSEENLMSCRCLQAREIDGHVHNTVADFVTMICNVQNANDAISLYLCPRRCRTHDQNQKDGVNSVRSTQIVW